MIVITSLSNTSRLVFPGDKFQLVISDQLGATVVVEEEVTVQKVIDFIASFRFALADGTCPGFHLMGVFACRAELPQELRDAVMLEDLSVEQRENFVRTVGIRTTETTR